MVKTRAIYDSSRAPLINETAVHEHVAAHCFFHGPMLELG